MALLATSLQFFKDLGVDVFLCSGESIKVKGLAVIGEVAHRCHGTYGGNFYLFPFFMGGINDTLSLDIAFVTG
jgi:hypothetical protein